MNRWKAGVFPPFIFQTLFSFFCSNPDAIAVNMILGINPKKERQVGETFCDSLHKRQ